MKGRRGRQERRSVPVKERLETLDIQRLGSGGEGVGELDGRPVFIPFTLPRERWRVRVREGGAALRGDPLEQLAGVAERALPICSHFGICGGCLLQHLPGADYRQFKINRISEALRRSHLPVPQLVPLAGSPLASRRRVRLAYERQGSKVHLGYRALRSHNVVDIASCPIAVPSIQALLPPLRTLLAMRPGDAKSGEVNITASSSGLDVLIAGLGDVGLERREALAAFASDHDLARLAVTVAGGEPEAVVTRRAPVIRFGDVKVALPIRSFLQATNVGQEALQAAVAAWVPDNCRVVDLFAGLGTLTLPVMARLTKLDLVEGEPTAVAALSRALAGRPRVSVLRRDLEQAPLTPLELASYDVAVLDPPRAGASVQIQHLAAAHIDRIIYVSCHPGSFARDAQHLIAAGFRLAALQAVDQFLFATDIELAALFLRGDHQDPAS